MALTETEIISVRMLLRLRSGMPNPSGASLVTTMLNRRINSLSPAAITAVQTILTQFSAVQFQSGELHGDYESSPQRQRDLLRRHLITVLDFDPADYGSPLDSPYPRQVERGS